MTIPSYVKIHHLGHHMVENVFQGPVYVQEKIDGSQFSFLFTGNELHFRSKGAIIHPPVSDKLFKASVDSVISLVEQNIIPQGMVFRCEAMCAPKHNTLCYVRAPKWNFIVFDIQDINSKEFMLPEKVKEICEALGLEYVFSEKVEISSKEDISDMMQKNSMLGGKREGLVFKNYNQFTKMGDPCFAKWVSEEFKEVHNKAFRNANPTKDDIIEHLISQYATEQRWSKAIQHKRENGELDNSPKDIGPLMAEIQQDVLEECKEEIARKLFSFFWNKNLKRGVVRGFPEWYKNRLMEQQFYGEV